MHGRREQDEESFLNPSYKRGKSTAYGSGDRPGKDGIPALLTPHFVSASEAAFLFEADRVLGLGRGAEAKAHPIKILNRHEIVNDTIDGHAVVVTYCPLCGTGIAFDANVQGQRHTFGMSGLLYQATSLCTIIKPKVCGPSSACWRLRAH